ncbi:MAG: hypothetical protein K0S47_704 [Herbinix sp.]|nr:hypothetical protein [Herbinix sp.]
MEFVNNNYSVADISDEDIKDICDLEKTLCSKSHKDIILIAYQSEAKDTQKGIS